jgi:hypothetical protein
MTTVNREAKILAPDQVASNGIIQGIDTVLSPTSLFFGVGPGNLGQISLPSGVTIPANLVPLLLAFPGLLSGIPGLQQLLLS